MKDLELGTVNETNFYEISRVLQISAQLRSVNRKASKFLTELTDRKKIVVNSNTCQNF